MNKSFIDWCATTGTTFQRSLYAVIAALLFTLSIQTVAHSDASWMAGKFGVSLQFTPATGGDLSAYNGIVDRFDVEGLADQARSIGASWVIMSLGQNGFFCSPNQALEDLVSNQCSRRDLIADLGSALHQRGIKLLVYMPSDATPDMWAGTG